MIIESVVLEWKKGANWEYGFTGRISIELYERWPPLALDYKEREDFFRSVFLSFHLDRVDLKCFLTFPSGLSLADHNPHSPTPSNSVHKASMTSGTITQETTHPAGTFDGKNILRTSHTGSVKRKLSHDSFQSELRRSERLARQVRTWQRCLSSSDNVLHG